MRPVDWSLAYNVAPPTEMFTERRYGASWSSASTVSAEDVREYGVVEEGVLAREG